MPPNCKNEFDMIYLTNVFNNSTLINKLWTAIAFCFFAAPNVSVSSVYECRFVLFFEDTFTVTDTPCLQFAD